MFKKGDIVKTKEEYGNFFGITNKHATMKVIEVNKEYEYIRMEVIEHKKDKYSIGKIFVEQWKYFEIYNNISKYNLIKEGDKIG